MACQNLELGLAKRYLDVKYSQIEASGRFHKTTEKWDQIQKDQANPGGKRKALHAGSCSSTSVWITLGSQ